MSGIQYASMNTVLALKQGFILHCMIVHRTEDVDSLATATTSISGKLRDR